MKKLNNAFLSSNETFSECYHRLMIRQRFNAQLFTTGLKSVFYHLKSVDCERSDMWKSFGLIGNEKNDRLDFVAC